MIPTNDEIREAVEFYDSEDRILNPYSITLLNLAKAFQQCGEGVLPEKKEIRYGIIDDTERKCLIRNQAIDDCRLRLLKNLPEKHCDSPAYTYEDGWNDYHDELLKRIGGGG